MYRQRFECTCGFHGYRELVIVPSHIKCPRCAGVAIATGAAEQVIPIVQPNGDQQCPNKL